MKRTLQWKNLRIQAARLLLYFVLIQAQAAWAVKPLVIAVGEWKPYISESLPNQGFAAQIFREAFANQGTIVELRFVPWKRAIYELESKRVDGSFLWTHTKKRAELYNFSMPIFRTKNVFFYRKADEFDWQDYPDLSALKVGWVDGYAIAAGFTKARKQKLFEVETVRFDLMGLNMLLYKRIDVFPASLLVGRQILHDEFGLEDRQKIAFHPKALIEHNLHFLVAKSNPKGQRNIINFNKGYRQLMASGRLKEIVSQALGPEYYDVIPLELVVEPTLK